MISEDFRYYLLANTPISNLVGDRVSPIIDLTHELPMMVYNIDGNIPSLAFGGDTGATRVDIQLDFYTDDYSDIDTIRTELITLFNGFSGTIGESNTTSVNWSEIDVSMETLDTADGKIYRLLTELHLWLI